MKLETKKLLKLTAVAFARFKKLPEAKQDRILSEINLNCCYVSLSRAGGVMNIFPKEY